MNINAEVAESGSAHCALTTVRLPPARNAVARLNASSYPRPGTPL
jgi:hypothetical protein